MQYDILVWGDEPSGLWLLNQIATLTANHPVKPNLLWGTLGSEQRPVPVPEFAAKTYQLPTESAWSLEIVTPGALISWDAAHLGSLSKAWNAEFIDRCRLASAPSEKDLGTLRFVLKESPEIYSLAMAVWNWFGRSKLERAETILWNALRYTQIQFWDPAARASNIEKQLCAGIARIAPKGKSVEVVLEDGTELLTHYLILSATVEEIATLCEKSPWLSSQVQPHYRKQALGKVAHYPLKLSTPSDVIPAPVRPISLYLDSLEIPDMGTETVRFEVERKSQRTDLTLWVESLYSPLPEALADSFCSALRFLGKVFPFLPLYAENFSLPLSDSCLSEASRLQWLEKAESKRIPLFVLSDIRSTVSDSRILLLPPSLECQQPAPLGALKHADAFLKPWLQQFLRRTRKAVKELSASSSV